jgi:hypothetical protein
MLNLYAKNSTIYRSELTCATGVSLWKQTNTMTGISVEVIKEGKAKD